MMQRKAMPMPETMRENMIGGQKPNSNWVTVCAGCCFVVLVGVLSSPGMHQHSPFHASALSQGELWLVLFKQGFSCQDMTIKRRLHLLKKIYLNPLEKLDFAMLCSLSLPSWHSELFAFPKNWWPLTLGSFPTHGQLIQYTCLNLTQTIPLSDFTSKKRI